MLAWRHSIRIEPSCALRDELPNVKLTVAIPSYRRPEELRRALEALVSQERRVDEVIVVARKDDAATHEVAYKFSSALPLNLEFVERTGMVEAVNRALDCATGDVVALTDDDAAPHPDWARKIVEAFENEPDLAGLGGRDHLFQNGAWVAGEAPVVGIVRWYGRMFGHNHLGVGPRRDVDCLKGVNMSFRKAALGKLRMDPRLRGTGAQWHCDLKLCLELRAQGKRLAYDPSLVVDHFPSQRLDEDQRGSFNALAYENQIYNLTLALLEYLRPVGRMVLLPYALLIGICNNYCGLLKGLGYCPRIGVRRAWQKTAASARGVSAAWKTWKAYKDNPA
jgi:cellulose synthase/poly-beta-1,6-N-acetylglucosamine synthase-like glycosyltransferase